MKKNNETTDMREQALNEEFNWFDEPSELEQLKKDNNHEYLWGGCFLNKTTGYIDKFYHKRKDKIFDVEFQICSKPGELRVILYNERGASASPGIIRNDWSGYREEVKGGSFYLEGIMRSMEKIKIRNKQVPDSEWF